MQGSFVIALVNILVGLIGLLYTATLAKLLGAQAIGLFQMTSAALTPFLILTTAGIPTAVSRLVAEYRAGNTPHTGRRIFETAMVFTLAISLCLGMLLTLLSGSISVHLFGNESLQPCLYLASPAVVVISLTALFRGYLYGLRLMTVAGASELIEHLVRFCIVIGLIALIRPATPQSGALIAVCGISLGELADLLWLIWFGKRTSDHLPSTGRSSLNQKETLNALLAIAGPLTVTGLSNTIMQSSNAILIPQRLMAAGLTEAQAAASYGRLAGMVFPLIFLPFTVTSALVINVIPNLSAQFRAQNWRAARSTASRAIGLTFLITVPLTVIYMVFSEQLGVVVFSDSEVGGLIRAMGSVTVFLAVQHTFSGILSGIGKQSQATCHRFTGLVIQLGTAYSLIGNPRFGINGYAVSFFLYTLIVCALDYRIIKNTLMFSEHRKRTRARFS